MEFLPPDSQLFRIEMGAFIPVAVVSGVGIVLSILFIAVNIKFRGYKLLKMTSPNLNLVMLSGAILLFSSVVLFGATAWLPSDPSSEALDLLWKISHAGVWLASVGFTLFFAPLAAKTWRVHRIFTDAAVKGRVIKDDRLLCFVAAFVVLDIGFLGLWLGLDTPQCLLVPRSQVPGFLSFALVTDQTTSETTAASPTVDSMMTSEYVIACASKFTPLWIILMTSYKAALLYYVIYVAWSTRYVTLPSMKDAGGMLISVFCTLTSFCVATPFVTSLHRWPTIQYIVMSCAIFLPVFVVLLLHFVPKIVLIRRHTKDEVLTRSFSQYATQRKPEFTDDEIRDLAIQNASLRKEVADKQRKYKSVLEQLRVAKAKLFEFSMMTEDSTDMLAETGTTDGLVSRSMLTETSPMTSTESERTDTPKDAKTKKKDKTQKEKTQKVFPKGAKQEKNVRSQIGSPADVSIDMTSSSSPTTDLGEEKINNEEVTEDLIVPRNVQEENSEVASLLPNKEKGVTGHSRQASKHRHVSFNDIPARKEFTDNRLSAGYPVPTHRSLQTLTNAMTTPKPAFPVLGKNSWDYYTRGTGYLKYKATVLNHGVNGTIAAITGYPVTDPNPNRIVARRNMVASADIPVFNPGFPVHSTPVLDEAGQNGTELKNLKEETKKTKPEFKYFSTSASSRSPSTSTDMTSSAAGHSNDDTMSNNNLHPVDQNKPDTSKSLSSNNDTDVPSANSAFSVVKSKEKMPRSGSNDVIVTSQTSCHRRGNEELMYDCYSSGSDSDDYDDSTTSMDSITCELFPPLSPRHKHYLRRYDVMHAKYLAQREKYGKRKLKPKYSEKSEGYSSGHEDHNPNDVTIVANDVTPSNQPTSSKKQIQKSISRKYLDSEAKRRLGIRLQRADDGYLYDSITSTDTDSDSDWGNTATLQKCWEKAAQNGRFPLMKAGPITYSHTRKEGIFV